MELWSPVLSWAHVCSKRWGQIELLQCGWLSKHSNWIALPEIFLDSLIWHFLVPLLSRLKHPPCTLTRILEGWCGSPYPYLALERWRGEELKSIVSHKGFLPEVPMNHLKGQEKNKSVLSSFQLFPIRSSHQAGDFSWWQGPDVKAQMWAWREAEGVLLLRHLLLLAATILRFLLFKSF